MPVRDGLWVSHAKIAAEKAATKAAEPEAVEARAPSTKVTPKRRTSRAAQAAIKDATGVEVELDASAGDAATNEGMAFENEDNT